MNPQDRHRQALEAMISAAFERGATDQEIARVSGYSTIYIATIRRRMGVIRTRGAKRSAADLDWISERLRAGATLQEIGDEMCVTRERVRQIAKRSGVTGKDSIQARREVAIALKAEKRQSFEERRDERYQFMYGCTYAEVVSLNKGKNLSDQSGPAYRYRSWLQATKILMKTSARLTFPQWCAAWGDKMELSGKGKGYRLARIDRHLGFIPGNVIVERGDESMARHRRLNPWNNPVPSSASA